MPKQKIYTEVKTQEKGKRKAKVQFFEYPKLDQWFMRICF